MRRTVFLKTLFEKRWVIVAWFSALLLTIVGASMMFPPIRDTMGSMTATIPESMQSWMGSADVWQTFAGFAGQEIYSQMALVIVVMAVVFGAALLAGDEADGRLLMVLARPVRRSSLYTQKFLALVVMLAIVSSTYFIGAVLGGWILREPVPYGSFFEASFMIFLLAVAVASCTYALGAITGRKAFAGLVIGFYVFVAYFVNSLAPMADIVETLNYGSLFRYVAAPTVLVEGLDVGNILVLLLIIVIAFLGALPVFMRRDLRTR